MPQADSSATSNAFVENIQRGRYISVIKSYKITLFYNSQSNEILKKPTLIVTNEKHGVAHELAVRTKTRAAHMG